MSVDDLLKQFLAEHVAAGHSPKTVDWYEAEVRRFLRWLLANQLQNGNWLKTDIVVRYLAECRKLNKNAPATVAGHYRGLHGFFAWLVEREYIDESPLAQIPPPNVPKKEPKRAELSEYDHLLESIPQRRWIDLRDRLVINTLFLCGLRLNECATLVAADFRTADHLLLVRNGKGGHQRLVPLLPAVEKAFISYLWVRPEIVGVEALFLAANGAGRGVGPISPSGIRQMLRRRCRKAEQRVLNPHSFRHGLAMHLLNQGGDMSLVQKILGHAQISTTAKHYAEWLTDGMLREFSEKMRGVGSK